MAKTETKTGTQVKVKTVTLQNLLQKIAKGVKSKDFVVISSMIGLNVTKNVLTVTATDGTNFMELIERGVDGDDFQATVEFEKFAKLIQKYTNDYTTLSLDETVLTVSGNGVQRFSLPEDPNIGGLQKYPVFPAFPLDDKVEAETIHLSSIQSIINTNKSSLGGDLEEACLRGYYCADQTISSNSKQIAISNISLFSSPALITLQGFEMLSTLTDEKITVKRFTDAEGLAALWFDAENTKIYTVESEDKLRKQYAEVYKAIQNFAKSDFPGKSKVGKQSVL